MDSIAISGILPEYGPGRVVIEQGLIRSIEPGNFGPNEVDLYLPDRYLTAGFIDLQINGALGHDFVEEPDSVYEVAEALPRWGCTGFLPTLVTSDFAAYKQSLKIIEQAAETARGARILGVHLEGPYLNERYKGAHDSRYLRLPNLNEMRELIAAGPVRLVTLAPELPGATSLIRELAGRGIVVSAGHTAATYEEALQAFQNGVGYVTHLFNAMPGLHHRAPGLISAALDPRTARWPYLGLILDGVHVHPALLRVLGDHLIDRVTLVTDAMGGMGMAPGRYSLAGQAVIVDEVVARLDNAQQTLAGSILTMDRAVRNAVALLDIPLARATRLANFNPAGVLGLRHRLGQLKEGYAADLTVLDPNLEVELTLVAGQIAYQRGQGSGIRGQEILDFGFSIEQSAI